MMTPETHDHALNCEITTGRGCDCGLTGMAGVAFYSSGVAVYKEPAERGALLNAPADFDLKAYRYITEVKLPKGSGLTLGKSNTKFVLHISGMDQLKEMGERIVKAALDRQLSRFTDPLIKDCYENRGSSEGLDK